MEPEAIDELIRSINSGVTDFVHWVTTDTATQFIGRQTLAAGFLLITGILITIGCLVLLLRSRKKIESLTKILDGESSIWSREKQNALNEIDYSRFGQIAFSICLITAFIFTVSCFLPDFLNWVMYPQGQLLKNILSSI